MKGSTGEGEHEDAVGEGSVQTDVQVKQGTVCGASEDVS